MTRQEFAARFAALTEVFRPKALGDYAVEAYYATLRELTADEWSHVVMAAMKTCKFMPAPAELLEFAGKGDDTERMAAFAWEAVRGAIRQHDSYASVDFGPVVNAVVRNMGGWIRLCDMTRDEATWKRKDFERLYAMFRVRPASELDGRALRGEHEGSPVRVLCEPQPERAKLTSVPPGAS